MQCFLPYHDQFLLRLNLRPVCPFDLFSREINSTLAVTFDYKVFTERGKPSGHAEEQASKTDIDTSDKFFAVCRRLLRIQGDTELVDLQCKLAKSQPWRAVLTAANVTTLLAEIKIREIKTKQQKPTTIFIVSKVCHYFS